MLLLKKNIILPQKHSNHPPTPQTTSKDKNNIYYQHPIPITDNYHQLSTSLFTSIHLQLETRYLHIYLLTLKKNRLEWVWLYDSNNISFLVSTKEIFLVPCNLNNCKSNNNNKKAFASLWCKKKKLIMYHCFKFKEIY